jgi:hypothetical protein
MGRKRRARRRQRPVFMNRHHIIPSSRHGSNAPSNIVWLKKRIHDLYHFIFRNRIPEEVVQYVFTAPAKRHWAYKQLFKGMNESQIADYLTKVFFLGRSYFQKEGEPCRNDF